MQFNMVGLDGNGAIFDRFAMTRQHRLEFNARRAQAWRLETDGKVAPRLLAHFQQRWREWMGECVARQATAHDRDQRGDEASNSRHRVR